MQEIWVTQGEDQAVEHVLLPRTEYDALRAVANAVHMELPHLERVIRNLERQGLSAGTLPGIYRELHAALNALDKEIDDEK